VRLSRIREVVGGRRTENGRRSEAREENKERFIEVEAAEGLVDR